MSNDAEAREVHATVTGSEEQREPVDGYRNEPATEDENEPAGRPGLTDEDDEVIDPDAVILAGDADDPGDLDDDSHPDTVVASAIVVEPVPADDTAAGPAPARPGMPVNGDVPKGSPMAGDPDQLHERWAAIQSTFVDDPRGSVTSAADMVTEVIATVVASAQERESGLRGEWDRDGADTESLRNALRSYRSLLDQLVAL